MQVVRGDGLSQGNKSGLVRHLGRTRADVSEADVLSKPLESVCIKPQEVLLLRRYRVRSVHGALGKRRQPSSGKPEAEVGVDPPPASP